MSESELKSNDRQLSSSINNQKDAPLVLLVGNPNSGKTSLFNALTGSHHKVANYPGVTVERKEAELALPSGTSIRLIDLPGIYSLSSTTEDERIAVQAIINPKIKEKAAALIIVVDSTNLERNLYLASELLDFNIPTLLVLNMQDLAREAGITIFKERLSSELGIPVVATIAKKGFGLEQLKASLEHIIATDLRPVHSLPWLDHSSELKASLGEICTTISTKTASEESVSRNSTSTSLDERKYVLALSGVIEADKSQLSASVVKIIQQQRAHLLAKQVDPASEAASARYALLHKITRSSTRLDERSHNRWLKKIDYLSCHRVFGPVIFMLVMFVLFQSVFSLAEAPMGWIEELVGWIGDLVHNALPSGQLNSLLVDGIIAGVGAVLVFLPQIALLIFLLTLLEDTGYLSRAAFLMDRILRPIGLQGRSFIPLMSSFACAIPGIMATRTIPSRSDRLKTILIAPLMSCSARLPVYTLLIAAFIPDIYLAKVFSLKGIVLFGLYFLGIIGAALAALLLQISIFRSRPSFFLMELPQLRIPSLTIAVKEAILRAKGFIKSAGGIILACSILLWALATYPLHPELSSREHIKESYAGQLGQLMEPVIKPLGFNWEIGVSIFASFAAREVFVTSLSTVYNLEKGDEGSSSLVEILEDKHKKGEFTLASAISLMVFYVFACQCLSTLAIVRKETGSYKWAILMFTYMTALAYISAFVAFKLAS